MKIFAVIRILVIPFGLLFKLWCLAREGSRDVHNYFRFKDAQIDAGCCINEKTEIEANTHVLGNCLINYSKIGSYSYIGRYCIIQNTTIGKYCSIANDVFIGLGKHPTDLVSTSPLFYRKNNTLNLQLVEKDLAFEEYANITIGNDVWIGTRAIIMDGLKIGTGAIVAANSVVTKDVPPYAIVAGVPAKILKYRFPENKIEELLTSEWWNWSLKDIRLKINEPNKN